MTTTQQLVVSVFRDHSRAEQAINELLQTGFDNRHIRFAEKGSSTGGMFEKIRNAFTGQDISDGGVYDDLVNLGVPLEDARYYQSEFEAGCPVVVVLPGERIQEAAAIMTHHGGYGANQRFAQSADLDKSVGAQEPTAEDVAEQNRTHWRQQEVRTGQETQQKATSNTNSNMYYDLVSTLYHALQAEQSSATYVQDAQQSGNQELAQFFGDVHQNASRQVERAKQLLDRTSSAAPVR